MARSDLDLAYIGGCIDSDGCISVAKSTNRDRSASYHEAVALGQVIPIVPYMLLERFGGTVFLRRQKIDNRRDCYIWRVCSIKANRMIVDILPYLRIKREQALNCLELRRCINKSKRHHRRPARYTRQMERYHRLSKTLNRVGTPDGQSVAA